MYKLSVQRELIAQHFLTVPNAGPENDWHSHHFQIDVQLSGPTLNENGYLVDIVEVEKHLDNLVGRYEDTTLNDLPEFQGLNPSVEHFARILCTSLDESLSAPNVEQLTVRVWEDDQAWASYSLSS